MLIRFGCSNFRSISEYQEILFTASSLKDEQSELIRPEGFNEPLLSSMAIYGANASGKTNILLALQKLVRFVMMSHKAGATTGINRSPFKLDSHYPDKASEFDIDFVCSGKHYQYGFKINDDIVLEEWLFAYAYGSRKSRKVLFHRNHEEREEFYFGKDLKGKNKIIQDIVRPNSLFLSAAAQNNHQILQEIYLFLGEHLRFRFSQDTREMYIAEALQESSNMENIIDFLGRLDTGIKRIEVKKQRFADKQLKVMKGILKVVQDSSGSAAKDMPPPPEEMSELHLYHDANDGELIKFSLDEESLGTKSVIALLIPIFHVLNNGGTLVVDELESSLHALLTVEIIRLFGSEATNPNGAQLLFSTHETNVLCSDVLRRDQIWFSEKSNNGNTVLTPLTDFQLRKEFNIQSGYLEGRFGGIPFFGDIKKLFSAEVA